MGKPLSAVTCPSLGFFQFGWEQKAEALPQINYST
jgi:hypothetical protein